MRFVAGHEKENVGTAARLSGRAKLDGRGKHHSTAILQDNTPRIMLRSAII
ncbi:MAG TPA: hypothetical protein VNX87_04600 [Candidatus Sulfotelmatobacter sp.]|jgi:hypothetical protein|nr:hypothetical protein [Candidatus Sulfotelmatobacter sp.]